MNTSLSPERLAANRANAQKSTGPQTPEGRSHSKMNAVKHGLLSNEVLVQCYHHKESENEFRALHDEFMSDLNPVGKLEEALVDQIVTTHWRLRRVLAAEAGEIAQSIDQADERQRNPLNASMQVLQWGMVEDVTIPMRETSAGCHVLKKHLVEVREAVERDGELTEATMAKLNESFAGRKTHIAADLEQFRLPLGPEADPESAAAMRERFKVVILKCLDLWIADYTNKEDECRQKEEWQREARKAASMLPSPEALEKLGRYETRLHRQFFRAIKELRALQKERKEEKQKAERNVGAGCGSENLPNEANALGAPVQGSKFKVQSSEMPNEPTGATDVSSLRSQIEGKLPNEPIHTSYTSQMPHSCTPTTRELSNEPIV